MRASISEVRFNSHYFLQLFTKPTGHGRQQQDRFFTVLSTSSQRQGQRQQLFPKRHPKNCSSPLSVSGRYIPPNETLANNFLRKQLQLRMLSNKSSRLGFVEEDSRSDKDDNGSSSQEIVLFERLPANLTSVRVSFLLSPFNGAFWIWYYVDFAPAVNASPLEALHVHYSIPWIGLTFAALFQAFTTLWPFQLVSKISWKPQNQPFTKDSTKLQGGHLLLYTYSLPWIQPASRAREFPLGNIRLSPSSFPIADRGDFSLYWGRYIFLWNQSNRMTLPFILHILEPSQVRNPEILWESIAVPEFLIHNGISSPQKKPGKSIPKKPGRSRLENSTRKRK